MKVYVIYSPKMSTNVGVFSTKENAKKYAEKILGIGVVEIAEFQVNNPEYKKELENGEA